MNMIIRRPEHFEQNAIDSAALEAAADETPQTFAAPEIDERTAELTTWDEPTAAAGKAAPKIGPDDETPPVERLIAQGLAEAERDRRIAAEDPDFEP